MKKRKTVGLALGSGGARGISHAGVIKVLEKHKIPIDYIAGASSGAIVGALYAGIKDAKKLEKIVLSATWKQIITLLDPTLKRGLIGGEKMTGFIKDQIKGKAFSELKIPFSVVATDLKTGEVVVLNRGDVARAMRASAAFPLVFTPIERGERILSDGGLSMPVPVEVVRDMGADVVIAVNLDGDYFSEDDEKQTRFGYRRIGNNSINILRHHLAKANVKQADIVITPRTGKVHWNKLMDGKDIFRAGEKATKEKIDRIIESIQ